MAEEEGWLQCHSLGLVVNGLGLLWLALFERATALDWKFRSLDQGDIYLNLFADTYGIWGAVMLTKWFHERGSAEDTDQ